MLQNRLYEEEVRISGSKLFHSLNDISYERIFEIFRFARDRINLNLGGGVGNFTPHQPLSFPFVQNWVFLSLPSLQILSKTHTRVFPISG